MALISFKVSIVINELGFLISVAGKKLSKLSQEFPTEIYFQLWKIQQPISNNVKAISKKCRSILSASCFQLTKSGFQIR